MQKRLSALAIYGQSVQLLRRTLVPIGFAVLVSWAFSQLSLRYEQEDTEPRPHSDQLRRGIV